MVLVPINIIAEQVFPKMTRFSNVVLRILEVLIGLGLGYAFIDRSDSYLSFLGAIFIAPVSIVIPSLIHIKSTKNIGVFERVLAWLFIIIGCIGGFITTIMSILYF